MFAARTVNTFVSALAPGAAWVGGYQRGERWRWSDGSRWRWRGSWAGGQPDNAWTWHGHEDYLGINFGTRGKWNDWSINGHMSWMHPVKGFICQYTVSNK